MGLAARSGSIPSVPVLFAGRAGDHERPLAFAIGEDFFLRLGRIDIGSVRHSLYRRHPRGTLPIG